MLLGMYKYFMILKLRKTIKLQTESDFAKTIKEINCNFMYSLCCTIEWLV